MEVTGKIETSEIIVIKEILNQTFDSILRQYNSLLFAIKDSAGMEALKIAEEQLKAKGIDISEFPNRDKLQFYITHYVQDIPAITRLQEYINKNAYPKNDRNQEQIKEGIMEAHLGLNSRLQLLHESENGIQEILTGWAMLQFIIGNPNRVSIVTIEQLIACGYQGTCGTSIMKEMFHLIQQLCQLQIENDELRKKVEQIQQEKMKKLD